MILITRFAPGAAGKIISTMLQTSANVASWDDVDDFVSYVDFKFPSNHALHLRSEPTMPLNMRYYSAVYDKGRNVTIEEFNEKHKEEEYFSRARLAYQYMNLISNKSVIPKFCYGAKLLDIEIDSKMAKRFVQTARMNKHYIFYPGGKVILCQHHPDFCAENAKEVTQAYMHENRPIRYYKTNYQFYKEQIVGDPILKRFTEQSITQHESNNEVDIYKLSLTKFLNPDTVVEELRGAFRYFRLTDFNKTIIKRMYEIWYERNKSYIHPKS